jgi:hypothetical protein
MIRHELTDEPALLTKPGQWRDSAIPWFPFTERMMEERLGQKRERRKHALERHQAIADALVIEAERPAQGSAK